MGKIRQNNMFNDYDGEVLNKYIFLLYFASVVWELYYILEDELHLSQTDDNNKKKVNGSRTEYCQWITEASVLDRENDFSPSRRLITT